MPFLKELCSKSANCSRTIPKNELSVKNSLVFGVVARRCALMNSLMTEWSMCGVSIEIPYLRMQSH